MKVLYIGPFVDGSGWAKSATHYAQALDAAGVEVVCRTVQYTGRARPLPEGVRAFHARESRGCDAVIQDMSPADYAHDARLGKNVGFFFVETSNFRSSHWGRSIDLLDEAWVACRQNAEAARETGVSVPVRVVPVPTDCTKFGRSYEPLPWLRDRIGDAFAFYFVGEGLRRKNLLGLVRAFHLEFDPDEPVELVIKSVMDDAHEAEFRRDVAYSKASLNIHGDVRHYKPEILLTDHVPEEEIMRLHETCDCFVSAAFGEGWSLPGFDAMALGKTPIMTAWGGPMEYLDASTGWPVPGRIEPVMGMQESHGDHYQATQRWCSPDLIELGRAMRQAYEDAGLRERKARAGIRRAYDFDLAAVGRRMRDLLLEQGR